MEDFTLFGTYLRLMFLLVTIYTVINILERTENAIVVGMFTGDPTRCELEYGLIELYDGGCESFLAQQEHDPRRKTKPLDVCMYKEFEEYCEDE